MHESPAGLLCRNCWGTRPFYRSHVSVSSIFWQVIEIMYVMQFSCPLYGLIKDRPSNCSYSLGSSFIDRGSMKVNSNAQVRDYTTPRRENLQLPCKEWQILLFVTWEGDKGQSWGSRGQWQLIVCEEIGVWVQSGGLTVVCELGTTAYTPDPTNVQKTFDPESQSGPDLRDGFLSNPEISKFHNSSKRCGDESGAQEIPIFIVDRLAFAAEVSSRLDNCFTTCSTVAPINCNAPPNTTLLR